MPPARGRDYASSMETVHLKDASGAFRFAPLRRARFRLGATRPGLLPADEGAEVAFAGRSNVGKSSVLNLLCGQKGLARVSRTPGRTQAINIFDLDPGQRLVDLPGYGYAKVPGTMRQSWGNLLEQYMRQRRSLKAVVLVVDIRHAPSPFDLEMLAFARDCGQFIHVVANKADKLSRGAAQQYLRQLRGTAELKGVDIQLFSALNGLGLEELHRHMAFWLGAEASDPVRKNPFPEAGARPDPAISAIGHEPPA